MKPAFFACLFALAACGDDESALEDAGVMEAPPDAGPTPILPAPVADGEYVIKVSPTSFACVNSGPQPLETFYAVADVVDRDAWTSDVVSELQGTLAEYDRRSLPRDEAGYFFDEREDPVQFWDYTLAARRRLEGAADGRTLAFSHRYDLGWYDDQDAYHSECVYEADIAGTLLHERWDGLPKDGVSGQWRVLLTVEESPLDYGQELPYGHAAVVTTLEQAPDGSMIEIEGLFRRSYGRPLRDPLTGEIDLWELAITPYVDSNGNARTMLRETRTIGVVLPELLDLEQTWHWWTAETESLPAVEHWLQRERYVGVPRYQPHDRAKDEPAYGTYVARYEMTRNDCGLETYAMNRYLRVLPIDGGAVWPRVTGFDREPSVTPAPDGTFSMAFQRATSSWNYAYAIDGAIGGHDIALTMDVTRTDPTDASLPCSATFEIAGEKVFMTARP